MARRTTRLPDDVRDLLRRGYGLFTNAEARAAGITHSRLHRLTQAELLTHLAHGCYVETSRFESLDEWNQFGEKARAFAVSCGPATYLVGWSAVVNWGLPTFGQPPKLPDVIRENARGLGPSATTHGRILVGRLPAEHRISAGRLRSMSQAWTAVDLARRAPVHHALIVAHRVASSGHDLRAAARHLTRWPGAHRARWIAEHADPNAESPLETLGRFTCLEFNLPMPVSNAWVGRDKPERRVDGLWPYHRAVSEADGALKYNDRADAKQIVRAQSEREFWLRRLGLDFVRYGAPDVYGDRAGFAAKIAALHRDNPPGDPIRWWKHVPGQRPVEPQPEDWPSPYPLGLILPAGWERGLDDATQ